MDYILFPGHFGRILLKIRRRGLCLGRGGRRNSHGLDHGGSRRRGSAPLLQLQRVEYRILFQAHMDIRLIGGQNIRQGLQPQHHHQVVQTGAVQPVCPLDQIVHGDPLQPQIHLPVFGRCFPSEAPFQDLLAQTRTGVAATAGQQGPAQRGGDNGLVLGDADHRRMVAQVRRPLGNAVCQRVHMGVPLHLVEQDDAKLGIVAEIIFPGIGDHVEDGVDPIQCLLQVQSLRKLGSVDPEQGHKLRPHLPPAPHGGDIRLGQGVPTVAGGAVKQRPVGGRHTQHRCVAQRRGDLPQGIAPLEAVRKIIQFRSVFLRGFNKLLGPLNGGCSNTHGILLRVLPLHIAHLPLKLVEAALDIVLGRGHIGLHRLVKHLAGQAESAVLQAGDGLLAGGAAVRRADADELFQLLDDGLDVALVIALGGNGHVKPAKARLQPDNVLQRAPEHLAADLLLRQRDPHKLHAVQHGGVHVGGVVGGADENHGLLFGVGPAQAVIGGEERGGQLHIEVGQVGQVAVLAHAVHLVHKQDARGVVHGLPEGPLHDLVRLAGELAVDIGAGQGHELIALLHQLVGKGLDDIRFAAARGAVEKEGLHGGDLQIPVQGLHGGVADAVGQHVLDVVHAGDLVKAVAGVLLVPVVHRLLGDVVLPGGRLLGGGLAGGRLLLLGLGVQLGPDLAHFRLAGGLIFPPVPGLRAGGQAGQLATDLRGPLIAEALLPAGHIGLGHAVALRLIDVRAVFVVQTMDILNIHCVPPVPRRRSKVLTGLLPHEVHIHLRGLAGARVFKVGEGLPGAVDGNGGSGGRVAGSAPHTFLNALALDDALHKALVHHLGPICEEVLLHGAVKRHAAAFLQVPAGHGDIVVHPVHLAQDGAEPLHRALQVLGGGDGAQIEPGLLHRQKAEGRIADALFFSGVAELRRPALDGVEPGDADDVLKVALAHSQLAGHLRQHLGAVFHVADILQHTLRIDLLRRLRGKDILQIIQKSHNLPLFSQKFTLTLTWDSSDVFSFTACAVSTFSWA
nr:MAG TPA: hypothetical protein [Caudoviricetes sp.]